MKLTEGNLGLQWAQRRPFDAGKSIRSGGALERRLGQALAVKENGFPCSSFGDQDETLWDRPPALAPADGILGNWQAGQEVRVPTNLNSPTSLPGPGRAKKVKLMLPFLLPPSPPPQIQVGRRKQWLLILPLPGLIIASSSSCFMC